MNRFTHCARNLVRLGLCAALGICAATELHAAGVAVVLPALTQPASGEHHVGKVVWTDLITPDLEGAKRFYGALFGWTFRDVPGGSNYVLALVDGEPVGGIFQKAFPSGPAQQPVWLTFLAVQDASAAQRTALQHGGQVLSPSHNVPHRGRQTLLADPDGVVFAALQAEGGDPSDYLAEPGTWIWSSLLVKDPQRESAFYKSLFGYDVYDLEGDAQHYILSNGEYARVGLSALPADAMRRRPHWLNFVRVANAADAAKKAVALGGRVLVEPRVDRHGGNLAVLADPSGAPFGVMEWSDPNPEQEPQ